MISISRPLAALVFLLSIACAEAPPPPPPQEAPMAETPGFTEVLRTSDFPSMQTGALVYGKASQLVGCPFDPRVVQLPAGGGLLVRFTAPVPTNLGMQLDTQQGPRRVTLPSDFDDEARLANDHRAYFYENEPLTRSVPTGEIAAREVAVWTGLTDRRFDLSLWDLSFAPRASGAELRSASMTLSLVGTCPDFTLTLARDSFDLRIGENRRVHATVTPSGDAVRVMTVAFSATPSAGISAALRDPELASSEWAGPRETTFDVSAAPQTPLGKGQVVLKARLGALERTATLHLNVLPKDDY